VRVAVIFHRFGPYHCARLEAAARQCDVTGIEVAAETQDYAWSSVKGAEGYSRVTLFPGGNTRTMSVKQISTRVEDALKDSAPDAVAIPGWSDNAALAALRWCSESGTPAILMSESTALDKPRSAWREWIKRRIVDVYSTALVGGERHVDYLVRLGMRRERIFTGYDVVDNEYFRQKAEEVRDPAFAGLRRGRQGSEVRKKYGLPENYFLASARFIEKKNLPTLIRSYARYRQLAGNTDNRQQTTDNRPWDLVLLGDGPLRETLNSQLSTLSLQDSVLLPGFKQYEELPVYYGLANTFVHASTTEQWGLVVNEAIASGLPVIVSNRCGCVPELVQDNGFTFDPMNQHELASRLFEMASLSDDERERLGDASRRIATNLGPNRFGEGLKRAATMAIDLPRRKFRAFDRAILFGARRFRR
jgi:glycosyltransferase involved in cell wall biosynthesis